MAPRIWRWLLRVQKICVPLYEKHENNNLTANYILKVKVRVKKSHKRPGVAQRVPGGLGSQISITFGT
jgi:hypothetical protein